jgi:hypothetical protein
MTRDYAKVSVGGRNARVLNGQDDLSDWTDEELIRGQKKAKNGRWSGRRPVVVPLALHQELNNRRLNKAKEILSGSIVRAAEVLREVMDDPYAENRDKLKAAELVFKTITGRADFVLQVEAAPEKWQELLATSIVAIDSDDYVLDVPSEEVGGDG